MKLSRRMVTWLKVEAARRGMFMGTLIEKLISNGYGGSPWA